MGLVSGCASIVTKIPSGRDIAATRMDNGWRARLDDLRWPSQLGIDSCCYRAQDWVASALTWVKAQGLVGALAPVSADGRPFGHVNVA
jgi:uncharacterized protein YceK